MAHSCPELDLRKKNSSKVCHIFLESKSYGDSKMVCWKILALGISELTLLNGPKNIKDWISGGVTSKKSLFWGKLKPEKKSLKYFYGLPPRLTFLGSKSSQNASIFHKKNYGGIKKYFFDVTPTDIQFLRFFRAI